MAIFQGNVYDVVSRAKQIKRESKMDENVDYGPVFIGVGAAMLILFAVGVLRGIYLWLVG